eukprot:XP_011661437.1 PREDICTED: uncharacterized protein LOC105437005 [Strongylocentrotus purpuratus]
MPNLTKLRLRGKDFQEEFYSSLSAKASTLQVKNIGLSEVIFPTSTSTHHFVDALCSMPNPTGLVLHGKDFQEEFYSSLSAKASTLQVKTIELWEVIFSTSTSTRHFVDALCFMPNLTKLRLRGKDFQEEFYSSLSAKASTLQVKTIELWEVIFPTSTSTHHFVDALCSMPNLTKLRLRGKDFQEEFYSSLSAKASTLQVKTIELWEVIFPTSTSTHHFVDALCSMPNLTKLRLRGKDFQEEFYSSLSAKASTLQVCMCVCTRYPFHHE